MRRTTLDLDDDLIAAARAALGTSAVTDTIHRALREAIGVVERGRLLEHDFSLLGEPGVLDALRTPAHTAA